MCGWKDDIHRLLVHSDLGADIAGDVAIVDPLAWPAPGDEFVGSALNLC